MNQLTALLFSLKQILNKYDNRLATISKRCNIGRLWLQSTQLATYTGSQSSDDNGSAQISDSIQSNASVGRMRVGGTERAISLPESSSAPIT